MKELVVFENRPWPLPTSWRVVGLLENLQNHLWRIPIKNEEFRRIFDQAKQLGYSDIQLDHSVGQCSPKEVCENSAQSPMMGIRSRLQTRRHLRRRIRSGHTLLLLDLRNSLHAEWQARPRRRNPPDAQRKSHHHRRRPQSDRPGNRIRLLLLSRRVRDEGTRLRIGDD